MLELADCRLWAKPALPSVFFNGLLAQKGFYIFFFELKKFLIKDIL